MIVHLPEMLTLRDPMMFHLTIGICLTLVTHVILEMRRTEDFREGPLILGMLTVSLHP